MWLHLKSIYSMFRHHLSPQYICLSTPSKLSPLAPKVANAVDRGPPNSAIRILPFIGLTIILLPACPQALVGAQWHPLPLAQTTSSKINWWSSPHCPPTHETSVPEYHHPCGQDHLEIGRSQVCWRAMKPHSFKGLWRGWLESTHHWPWMTIAGWIS